MTAIPKVDSEFNLCIVVLRQGTTNDPSHSRGYIYIAEDITESKESPSNCPQYVYEGQESPVSWRRGLHGELIEENPHHTSIQVGIIWPQGNAGREYCV